MRIEAKPAIVSLPEAMKLLVLLVFAPDLFEHAEKSGIDMIILCSFRGESGSGHQRAEKCATSTDKSDT